MSDPREAKLPRWAQDELEHLRRRVDEAESFAEQARLATDPEGSDALLIRFMDEPIGLGTQNTIRFRERSGEPWGRYHSGIEVHVTRDGVRVAANDGQLQIRPIASNCAYVNTIPR